MSARGVRNRIIDALINNEGRLSAEAYAAIVSYAMQNHFTPNEIRFLVRPAAFLKASRRLSRAGISVSEVRLDEGVLTMAAEIARANGVGPKLAGRIVNELKDKAGALPGGGDMGVGVAVAATGGASADAVSALENLGFKPAVAARAVAAAQGELGENAGEGDLIRVALKRAAG